MHLDNILLFDTIEHALSYTVAFFKNADLAEHALRAASPGIDLLSLLSDVNAVFKQYDHDSDGESCHSFCTDWSLVSFALTHIGLLTINEVLLSVRTIAGITLPAGTVAESLQVCVGVWIAGAVVRWVCCL